jgi:hypothetical protein
METRTDQDQPVRIGKIRFHGWESLKLSDSWSDTFIFRLSLADGLPPADYARVIRTFIPGLLKLRRSASLWVQVDGEGQWYRQEARRALWGMRAPVAVTTDSIRPQFWDFTFSPRVDPQPWPRPPTTQPYFPEKDLTASALRCLRVLARADCGYTAEVASLVGLGRTATLGALKYLQERRWVRRVTTGKYPFWQIRLSGLSTALRSWWVPPGMPFPQRKERGLPACKERNAPAPKKRRASSGRHRRTARLWPAWLRKAWPQATIWAGWSEVACGRARPDALCWGSLGGYETLFWLEVESGHGSGHDLQERTVRRTNRALIYARRVPVRLVFILLGPPWVRREAVKVFQDLPRDLAVVLEDWKAFGTLPVPAWGKVRWQ